MTQEELTVGDVERWLEKLEMLTSRGSKIIHVQQLLKRGADYIIGEDEGLDPSYIVEGSIASVAIVGSVASRNALRFEQRERAGL